MEKEYPMVRVTWRDAQDGETGWQPIDNILNHDIAICQEVGWMVSFDAKKVIIMRSRVVEDTLREGGAHIAIPRDWLQRIEVLEPTSVWEFDEY